MNIDNPLVSIFILCYNHGKYISQAIESVINQTYKNIEIVIVDNASTDNSKSIIESYSRKDTRIKFFPMEHNLFPSAGSNFAIKQCKGDYICALSADDYFELNKVDVQLKYMLSNDLTNTFTWVKVIDDNMKELIGHWADNLFNREFLPNEMEKIFITQGNSICAITWMFKKTMFEKYGYFDHRLLQTQDFDLWLRISKNEKLNLLKKKLTCYRVRDDGNNLSSDKDNNVYLRTSFESTYYIRRILDFDNQLLSEIMGKVCNDENKYKILFDYYKCKNMIPSATAVLYAMYEKLGSNFKFPSSIYSDFFSIYSTYDFMGVLKGRLSTFFIQLYIEKENTFLEENSTKFFIQESNQIQKFEFDLRKHKNITSLRLDPLNDSCIIEIEKIYLILENFDEVNLLPYVLSNNVMYFENKYFFEDSDPQINFIDLDINLLDPAEKLCIELKYNYISKDALHQCVKQIMTNKNKKISILENELIGIYTSKS